MNRMLYRRLTGALGAVVVLASVGGLAIILVISGGSGLRLAQATTPLGAPAAVAGAASTSPAAGGSSPAPTEGPPPVVNGVTRTNVGSAHSPKIQQQLAGPPPTAPPPMDAGALGVDVADYQHPHGAAIDWSQVASAGYKFAFIKATEGNYYANPFYANDLAQAEAAGLNAAGYSFAIPNVSGGASQADYAVQNSNYTANGRTLPLALDIEYNPYGAECYGLSAAQMVSWISAFTAEAQRLTGQAPIIYTTADWWQTCTGNSTSFGSDPLWIAGWVNGSPPMPAGWANWTFWQYTSRGSVPGITTNVDVSYFLLGAVRLLDPGNQQDAPGASIQLQISSLNAAAGQSPDFAASNLPPGLSINGSGLISGTISMSASGPYGVTVTATYPSGSTGSVSFTWTVAISPPSNPPTPSPSPSGSASPSPSPSPSPSASASPSASSSASASGSDSPSPSASTSPPATAFLSPAPSSSTSASPSPSPSLSSSSCSPSPSPSTSPSPSPSSCCPSPSPSPSSSPSPSPSPSPSSCCPSPSPSPSSSSSPSASPSSSPTPSSCCPSPSPSPTPSSPSPSASPSSSPSLECP